MGFNSTGLMNKELGQASTRELMNDGKKVIWGFSGAIPADADAAETGTRVVRITTAGASAKVKQKVTITPVTAGTTGTWTVVLNGVTFTFTDDGSPTANEVATGLFRLINTGQGASAKYFTTATDGAITAGGIINIPDIYQLFAVVDATGSITIEAATAGIPFEYSATATGAGNSLTAVLTTDNAFCLRFEPNSGVSGGILERKSGDTWKGTFLSTAVLTHARLMDDDDTGALSTTAVRMQGLAATANAEFVFSHVDGTIGEEVTCSLGEIYKEAEA